MHMNKYALNMKIKLMVDCRNATKSSKTKMSYERFQYDTKNRIGVQKCQVLLRTIMAGVKLRWILNTLLNNKCYNFHTL
jgi:hypothetical protein